jgi:hypothetical protein
MFFLEEKYSKMFNKELGVDVEWAIDGTDEKIYIYKQDLKQYILMLMNN